MKIKPLKIGKLKINSPIILAPMADITDLPYRLVCRKAGCSLCFTEMIYVDAIIHENAKTKKMMQTKKKDSPLGVQITGNNIENFKKTIPYLKKYAIADINCGCPSEKIIGSKAGSYLLSNPSLLYEIIKLLKQNNLIVTAKIRLGYDKNNALEIAKTIEKAGADAITIHSRLAIDGYDKKADWNEIKKIKKVLKIPIIANGDILDEESALSCLKQTGCDGIMIARGAIGDPLIFKRINYYIKNNKKLKFNIKDNIKYLQLYLKYCKLYRFNDISRIKRISCKFIKNIPRASKIRNEIMQAESLEKIVNMINQIN